MPMWSVATEWQIYFVFPLLLLARRRLGAVASIVLGLLVGYASIPLTVALGREYLQMACPWMLGAFALGMAAAEISAMEGEPRLAWRERVPWRLLAASLAIALCLIRLYPSDRLLITWYWTDLITGLATSCLLIGCTLSMRRGDRGLRSMPLNVFSSRWAVTLGAFSYSLYLVHQPVISLIHLGVRRWQGAAYFATMLVVATPLCLASGYLMFHAVERRFLPSKASPKQANL
jgi:peptidoglycan/LPS O-acetylase OafA/YrhL